MSIEAREAARVGSVALERRAVPWRAVSGFVKRKPLGAIGGLLILIMVATAIFAPLIAPHDPYAFNRAYILAPPGGKFILGTDDFGRDMLSRIIWGSRISLYVGILSIAIGHTLGGLLGLVSGFFGGKVDAITQRFVDILMSFPTLVLALAIMAALGSSINNVVAAIAIVELPRASRVLRSSALSVKAIQYVEAARVIGCSDWRILLRHILPNCLAPFIIIATAGLGVAIVVEASLSFLGMGTPQPEPSWGLMLSGVGLKYAETAPWLAMYPGVALSLAVFGFNLLGDALRDVLDPRLRGQ